MLTDTQCRNAKLKDKPYKLLAGKGLYLEVKPNGVKAWRYRFERCKGGTDRRLRADSSGAGITFSPPI
jgi:hypothetical protein